MSNEGDNNEFPPGEGGHEGEGVPLSSGKPSVSAAPGKMVFVIGAAVLFIAFIAKELFFSSGSAPTKPPPHPKEVVAGNATPGDFTNAPNVLPGPSSSDSSINAAPPPPPPPLPAILNPPAPDVTAKGTLNEALEKRIHSSMLLGSSLSSKLGLGGSKKHSSQVPSNDPNSVFAQSVTDNTSADSSTATHIEHLNRTIAQGKFIQAVLETAISTDLPGPLRAIVSHDIYAEMGRDVLIPKGSRLIGVYNASVRRGQNRVFIIWTRIIRPDGVDIFIDSPGVDTLGRAGVAGDVDNKYFEMFSTALLTSSLDIGVAAIGQGLFGNQQTTTTNNGTGSTTTESPTATAMQEAVQNIGQVGSSIVSNVLNLQPTIYIDQGTPMNVFVSKELIFPGPVTGMTENIP